MIFLIAFQYIYIVYVCVLGVCVYFNLPSLRATNVDRSNERKWVYAKKKKVRSRRYPAETFTDADYADDIALFAQAEPLLHSLQQTAGDISLHLNANKTEYVCFKREGAISTLSGRFLNLVSKFIYLGSNISSTVSDINVRQAKA